MSAGFCPDHKAAMVLFLDRVYGIEDQNFLLHLLEVGFLPDLRAAASLDTVSVCVCVHCNMFESTVRSAPPPCAFLFFSPVLLSSLPSTLSSSGCPQCHRHGSGSEQIPVHGRPPPPHQVCSPLCWHRAVRLPHRLPAPHRLPSVQRLLSDQSSERCHRGVSAGRLRVRAGFKPAAQFV